MELELELELELKLELELIASDCKAFAHSDGGLCRFRAASAHLGCAKTGRSPIPTTQCGYHRYLTKLYFGSALVSAMYGRSSELGLYSNLHLRTSV